MHKSCITNQATKVRRWKFSMKKLPKGLLFASDGTEIQVQGQISSPACRLVGRDHSIYSIPATHAKLVGKSQLSCLVSAEKDTPDPESCEEIQQCTAKNAMWDLALGSVLN
jgi:hypothetical protein